MLPSRQVNQPDSQFSFAIPDGPEGVRETLKIMRALVLVGKQSPLVRAFALALISDLDQKDVEGEIVCLFAFVRDGIRYVHDVSEFETVQTADRVLKSRAGDCDCKVVLLCSLLESLGYQTFLHAVGFRRGELTHVYADVVVDGRLVALDATEPVFAGWYPPDAVEHMIAENRSC